LTVIHGRDSNISEINEIGKEPYKNTTISYSKDSL